mmetsp:Transcript_29126/g.69934  ORF Transcript_29126/g.69934 Transcript_29126/m.69934 type:complete len:330 (-) Transcript_29126:37-1026(-)
MHRGEGGLQLRLHGLLTAIVFAGSTRCVEQILDRHKTLAPSLLQLHPCPVALLLPKCDRVREFLLRDFLTSWLEIVRLLELEQGNGGSGGARHARLQLPVSRQQGPCIQCSLIAAHPSKPVASRPPSPLHNRLKQAKGLGRRVSNLLQLLELCGVGLLLLARLLPGLLALRHLLLPLLDDGFDAAVEVVDDGLLGLDGLHECLLLGVHEVHVIVEVVEHVAVPVQLGMAGRSRPLLLLEELVHVLLHPLGRRVDGGRSQGQIVVVGPPILRLLCGQALHRFAAHTAAGLQQLQVVRVKQSGAHTSGSGKRSGSLQVHGVDNDLLGCRLG